MTTIIISETTVVAFGYGRTLFEFDNLFVAPGASLIASGPYYEGVLGISGENTVNAAGFIYGYFGVDLSGTNSHVKVHAGGGIIGEAIAVYLDSAGGTVMNRGDISGNIGVWAVQAVTVTNFGSIAGYGNGYGGGYGITANGQLTLQNYGTISGPVGVQGSGVADTILNRGIITGTVLAWGGDDSIDNIGGRIDGLVDLGAGNDSFLGGDWAEFVMGGEGEDDLSFGAGRDRFIAQDGDGDDDIDGSSDIDIYDARQVTTQIIANLGTGLVRNAGATDTLVGIEQIWGGSAADILTGSRAANLLRGEAGDDSLSGGSGNDRLIGGNDNDRLVGDDGNDILQGGSGVDLIYGGAGNDLLSGDQLIDTMTGGLGADVFDFNRVENSFVYYIYGPDRITDFVQGSDKIDLSTIDANQSLAGNQAFAFVGTDAIDAVGEMSYRTTATTTIISMSINDLTPLDVIQLDGVFVLTLADFVL